MTHIQQRRDQATLWTLINPVLMDGESGHESDTGREKMGDGVTPWNALPYKYGVDSVANKTGVVLLDVADVAGAAPLASPALTGSPTAPTPATSDNDTSIATTEFVKAQGYAPLVSPVFTGNPTAPTPAVADDDSSVATTGFVKDALAASVDGTVPWTTLYDGPATYNYTAAAPATVIPGGGPFNLMVPAGRTLEVHVQLPRLDLNGAGGLQVWIAGSPGQVTGGYWENPAGDGMSLAGSLTHTEPGTGVAIAVSVNAYKLGTNGGYIRGIGGQQGPRIKYRIY